MALDLDEILYSRVVKFLKNKRRTKELNAPQRVALEDIKPRLTLLARAFTGTAIDIYPAESEGGYKNTHFFLPTSFSLLPTLKDNINFYLFRILYLSVQFDLKLNLNQEESSLLESRIAAKKASEQILPVLFRDYPPSQGMFESMINSLEELSKSTKASFDHWIFGKLMFNENTSSQGDPLQSIDPNLLKKEETGPTTILQAKATEEIKSLAIDKKQQEDYVLLHSFEKVETAEEFSGGWRDFDGDDQLDEHQNALDELNLKNTVRVDHPTHSVYQAEFVENANVRESATTEELGYYLSYPEWNYKKNTYLIDYCRVYPLTETERNEAYYQRTLNAHSATLNGLRKMLTSVNNKLQQQRRQSFGEDLDIDAITDLYVDVHARKTPSENVYTSKRKKDKDLSILLLFDMSLSSDGYAAGSRVIDVEKEVSILFGEILDEFNIDFAIDGFHSKTRNYSSYTSFKEFDENWSSAKFKVGAAQPSGYTRIGAAIRHAGARIASRPTQNKWIILLSDGKPNDYDKYEGQYGIHDVKQALRELNGERINTYALAIEAQARYYLPLMFGNNHYQILTSPTELIQSLVKLYERIKHS